MLKYYPEKTEVPFIHQLLLGGVAPRPIALVSTISKTGVVNLSPFSFFNTFSANPPIIAFSPARRGRDATLKDTYLNLIETKQCVINAVTYSMVEQVSLASAEYAPEVDEFSKSGLTKVESEFVIPPGVLESPFRLECELIQMINFGEGGAAGNLAICEVKLIYVDEDVIENGKIIPDKIDLVARMSGDFYCRASGDSIFEVVKPVGKKCIGYDQLPGYIKESKILSANDLAKLANVEKLPQFNKIANEVLNEKLPLELKDILILNRFQRQGNYKKMFEKLKVFYPNETLNSYLDSAASLALKNNDIDYAWRILLFRGGL
ncbi:MAG: flavin reductase family protein [Ignavibacteriaceae bacterium]|nr:flavin reductase family protein [Ignavibacteriaceae bacterium]